MTRPLSNHTAIAGEPTVWPAKKGIRTRHPETALQIAVAAFLTRALPANVAWSAFPAGGGGKIRGGILKAMGLRAGFPDLVVIHPDTGRAVWLELKAPGGVTSSSQKAIHALLMNSQSPVTVARSVDQVEHFLRANGFQMRATTGAAA